MTTGFNDPVRDFKERIQPAIDELLDAAKEFFETELITSDFEAANRMEDAIYNLRKLLK